MALWGVSGSDVKNVGWNAAVGLGILIGSTIVAALVKKGARIGYSYFNPKATDQEKKDFKNSYASWGSFVIGSAAGYIATLYLPSRCAVIVDLSTSKMFKVGAATTVAGWILDMIAHNDKAPFFTLIGAGVALAGRFTQYPVLGLGALGAAVASGLYHPRD